jgi:hypothetical protein
MSCVVALDCGKVFAPITGKHCLVYRTLTLMVFQSFWCLLLFRGIKQLSLGLLCLNRRSLVQLSIRVESLLIQCAFITQSLILNVYVKQNIWLFKNFGFLFLQFLLFKSRRHIATWSFLWLTTNEEPIYLIFLKQTWLSNFSIFCVLVNFWAQNLRNAF